MNRYKKIIKEKSIVIELCALHKETNENLQNIFQDSKRYDSLFIVN